ncbi:hypothetical protein QFC21_000168 [Naganishia friedmannii]|uniref:Uncharacterized protein n=1 Tax=Naganishia friedmannii TaxID=89922 RepID=A0ACC2WAT4_9TREE|nr:hypothetical protein QFC21_000168 [Naganishia friedmannii]
MAFQSVGGRGQAVDLFTEDRDDALDPQWGSLRYRRRERSSLSDPVGTSPPSSIGGSSGRNSPHPLHPTGTPLDPRTNYLQLNGRTTTPSPSIPNIDEVSRPNLFRLTSDLEREVQAAGVISRSSVDEASLRASLEGRKSTSAKEKPKEVEVIVHELSTLRKVNKLWPTDPLHLRRQLYVPLDACRWAKASEMFVRGPGEGEITILNKKSQGKKGTQNTLGVPPNGDTIISGPSYVGKGKGRDMSPQETPTEPHHSDAVPLPQNSPLRPIPNDSEILSIIRIPASELSFFPKNANKPLNHSKNRTSLDLDTINNIEALRRASSAGSPSSSRNSFSTAPRSVVSSPSSLRNSFESITRPFSGGRLKSMTPIDETGSPLGNPTTTRSTQQPIELQSRRSNDTLSTVNKKKTQQRPRPSSGWNFNFFSVADDGLDPTDIGNIKI